MRILSLFIILLCSNLSAEIHPYLQSPTHTSMIVNWESADELSSRIRFAKDSALQREVLELSFATETIQSGHVWHTVELSDLQPDTRYFYKVVSSGDSSLVHSFITLPAPGENSGNMRFIVRSDNQSNYVIGTEVVNAIVTKLQTDFGPGWQRAFRFTLNAGDIVGTGSNIDEYQREYFIPLRPISPALPSMISIGNHEQEHSNYYKYMKYDRFAGPEGEAYYAFQAGRLLVIAVNSNSKWRNDQQIEWLSGVIDTAAEDETIDFIFTISHHPPRSSVWKPGDTEYIRERVIPVLQRTAKSEFLINGHTHAYERGSVREGTLRLMIIGGSGGNLDRWSDGNWANYPEHHRAYDHYHWGYFDVDFTNHEYKFFVYSLGHPDKRLENVLIDSATIVPARRAAPDKPMVLTVSDTLTLPIDVDASAYSGPGTALTGEFQVSTDKEDFSEAIVTQVLDFEDIFLDSGAPDWQPIDQNAGRLLNRLHLTLDEIALPGTYYVRFRYRAKSLIWSPWSESGKLIIGNTGYIAPQSPNQLYKYDGRESHLHIDDDLDKVSLPSREMTVETWVRMNTSGTWGGFIGAFQDNGDYEKGWVLGNYPSDRLSFGLASTGSDDGNGNMTYLSAASDLRYGLWYHLAASYDGNTMNLYINGRLSASTTAQSGDILYDRASFFDIGVYHDDNEFNVLDGELDEMRLWNRALTSSEIRNNMHSEVGPEHPRYSHLISHWDFNALEDGEYRDRKGSNHASLINGRFTDHRVSSAPLGSTGTLLELNTSKSLGDSAATVKVIPVTPLGSQNYVGMYQQGSHTGGAISYEELPDEMRFRSHLLWGVHAYGTVTVDLEFSYGAITNLPHPDSLFLIHRQNGTATWHDITAQALHDKETFVFRLSRQSGLGEYALAWVNEPVVSIAARELLPANMTLGNAPNPFNPSTQIYFTLPSSGVVDLKVYDISGQLVNQLISGEHFPLGSHDLRWDGRNQQGQLVASGIYLMHIRSGQYSRTAKMTLLR